MKEITILACIWGKHMPILYHYLARLPDTHKRTLIFMQYLEDATITALDELDAKVLTLKEAAHAFSEMEKYEVQKDTIKTRTQMAKAFNMPAWKDFCSQIGAPLKLTTDTISQKLYEKSEKINFYIKWLEKFKRNHFIELIITSEDVTAIARTTILWGQKERIPSLQIQHSPGTGRQPPIHNQHLADHMTVYGERAADAFAISPNEPLHITGNHNWAVYTRHHAQTEQVRTHINNQYTLPDNTALVLFGTTWASQLSAHIDQQIHAKTLATVCHAISLLKTQGHAVVLVIKDRDSNAEFEQETQMAHALAAKYGLTSDDFRYTTKDLVHLIIAADVVISSDSSLSVEAMHALTPAINVDTQWPMILGPSFHAEDGILSVIDYNAEQLARFIQSLLFDPVMRKKHLDKMQQHVGFFNASATTDKALDNITDLMKRIKRPLPA